MRRSGVAGSICRVSCVTILASVLLAVPSLAFGQGFAGGSCNENGVPNSDFSGCGTPDLFRIQVLEANICESPTCGEKVLLGAQAAFFDIASVGPNSVVGAFAPAGVQVPTGVYTHAYLVLSRNITFRGRFSVARSNPPPGGAIPQDCISISGAQLFPDGQLQGQAVNPGTGTPQPTTSYYSDAAIAGVDGLGIYTKIQALDAERMAITIAFASPFAVTERTRSFSLRSNVNIRFRFNGFFNLDPANGPDGCHVGLTDPAITVSVTAQ